MNLIELFFTLIIIFVFVLYHLIRWMRWSHNTRRIGKMCVFLISMLLYFMFSFISFKIFMSDFYKPSSVDISPFSEISNADFSDVEVIVNMLQQSMTELGENFEISRRVREPIIICEYDYRNSGTSTSVYIDLYDDEKQAKAYFDELYSELRSGNLHSVYMKGSAGKYIKNSENVEAILGDSWIPRSSDTFYQLGSKERIMGTSVRVKNMCIEFKEHGYDDGNIGQLTNEAIINLCEVLSVFVS